MDNVDNVSIISEMEPNRNRSRARSRNVSEYFRHARDVSSSSSQFSDETQNRSINNQFGRRSEFRGFSETDQIELEAFLESEEDTEMNSEDETELRATVQELQNTIVELRREISDMRDIEMD